MDRSTAERWVVISALVVAGVYAYRRLSEQPQPGTLQNLLGVGPPVPLSKFMTAWGFVYFMLAIATEAAPGLGGSMAILIATGDFLTNSADIFGRVQKTTAKTTSSSPSSPSSAAAPASFDATMLSTVGIHQPISHLTTTPPPGLR